MPGRHKQFISIFIAWLSVMSSAYGSELLGPEVGVIPFGMGRAYTAVADDWLALHYNPAGLALVNSGEFQAFDLKLGTNSDTIKSTSTYGDIQDSDKTIAGVLNSLAGKHVRVEGSNVTQVTLPHLAFGVMYDVKADVDVQNPSYPAARVRYIKDLSVPVGVAGSFGKNKDLRVGAKVAFIRRRGGTLDVPITQLTGSTGALLDQVNYLGSGWSTTLGAQYRLPSSGRTEVNLGWVWHDVGKTSFGNRSTAERPTRNEDVMTVGASVRFPIGGKQNRRLARRYGATRSTNHLTIAADYSHLNKSLDKEHLPKHLHLGMNLDLPILSLQMGINQTSLTFGLSFDVGVLRIATSTYAEELGSYAGQQKDRRYLLSIGSSFGVSGFGGRR